MAQRQFASGDTAVWGERYGNGSAGPLSVASNTTDSTACTPFAGTGGGTACTVGSGSGFADGDLVLIHQTREGATAGDWELNKIASGASTTSWTLAYPLINTYASKAQVYLLKQYTNATIDSGATYTAQAWNGSALGIIAILASGTVTVTGSISATGKGFRGGTGDTNPGRSFGTQGESSTGAGSDGSGQNGSAGGGGQSTGDAGGGGAGSSHGGAGSNGSAGNSGATGGSVGATQGTPGLTSIHLAAGGGGGGIDDSAGPGGSGGTGGGIVIIIAPNIIVTGSIVTNGNNGTSGGDSGGGGGGAAGGSILLKGQNVTLNSATVTGTGGTGAAGNSAFGGVGGAGGNGGLGRTHVDYSQTLSTTSATLSPAIDSTLDVTLNDLPRNDNYSFLL